MADWNDFRLSLEESVTPPPLERLRQRRRQRQQRRAIATTCAVAMVGTAGFVAVLGQGGQRPGGPGDGGTPIAAPTALSQVVNSDRLPPPKDYEQHVVTDVDFVSPTTGWALGLRCVGEACDVATWRTDDGGRTWGAPTAVADDVPRVSFHAEDPAGGAVRSIRMVDADHGFAFNPDLYVTSDGAKTWRRLPRTSKVASISVVGTSYWVTERGCAAGVDCDLVVRAGTVGGAAPAALKLPPTKGAAASVRRAGPTDGYVVAWDAPDAPHASFLRTRDAGRTWSRGEMPCPDATAVSMSAGGTRPIWLVCTTPHGRGAYQSTDHGSSWRRLADPPADGVVTDLIAWTGDDAYLTTQTPGQLLVTGDGGATWRVADGIGKGYGYGNLDVPSVTHAFAMGDAGLLWRTTDGKRWERLALPPGAPRAAATPPPPPPATPSLPRGLRASDAETYTGLSFLDPLNGWAVGNICADDRCRVILRRTVDGGATWLPATAPDVRWDVDEELWTEHGWLTKVAFADPLHGWLYGDRLFATTDGGRTWRDLGDGDVPQVVAAGGVAWSVAYTGCPDFSGSCRDLRIRRTPLGASPSAPVDRRDPGVLRGSFDAVDADTAYYLDGYDGPRGRPAALTWTADGGRTWRSTAAPCDDSRRALSAYAPGGLWVLCGAPTVADEAYGPQRLARSTDDGLTWQVTPLPGRHGIPGEIEALSARVAWRTGSTAGVLGTRDGGRTWQAVPGMTSFARALTFADATHGWVITGNVLWRTTDGATWERLG